MYCLVSAFSGSLRIRTKSASLRLLSSTRMGNRPCNSGIRSLGLARLKAPAAMKRISDKSYYTDLLALAAFTIGSGLLHPLRIILSLCVSAVAILSISSINNPFLPQVVWLVLPPELWNQSGYFFIIKLFRIWQRYFLIFFGVCPLVRRILPIISHESKSKASMYRLS